MPNCLQCFLHTHTQILKISFDIDTHFVFLILEAISTKLSRSDFFPGRFYLSDLCFGCLGCCVTTFVIRGELSLSGERGAPLWRGRDYICRGGQRRRSGWSQGAVRSGGLDVNAAAPPPPPPPQPPNPFSTRNRAIYGPAPVGPIPFRRSKGGKSRAPPRESRTERGRERERENGFPEQWPSVSL